MNLFEVNKLIGQKSAAIFFSFLASLCILVLCVIDTAAAQAKVQWIHITSGASSKEGNAVQYTADENEGAKRTGTITAAGKTFSITQKGSSEFKKGKTSKGTGEKQQKQKEPDKP